jgi:phosphatidate phosphatase LPIN
LFSISCSLWKILFAQAIREEGVFIPVSGLATGWRLTETQVEFKVNNVKQNYSMKLGEGGEAFFVFETSDDIPEGLQTSPLISPATSPDGLLAQNAAPGTTLQEPEYLDLSADTARRRVSSYIPENGISIPTADRKARSDMGMDTLPWSGTDI